MDSTSGSKFYVGRAIRIAFVSWLITFVPLSDAQVSDAQGQTMTLKSLRALYEARSELVFSFYGHSKLLEVRNWKTSDHYPIGTVLDDSFFQPDTDYPPDFVWEETYAFQSGQRHFAHRRGSRADGTDGEQVERFDGTCYTWHFPTEKMAVLDIGFGEDGDKYRENVVERSEFGMNDTSLDFSMMTSSRIGQYGAHHDMAHILNKPDARILDESEEIEGFPTIKVQVPAGDSTVMIWFAVNRDFAVKKLVYYAQGIPTQSYVNHDYEKVYLGDSESYVWLPKSSSTIYHVPILGPESERGKPLWSRKYEFSELQLNHNLPGDLFHLASFPKGTVVQDRINNNVFVSDGASSLLGGLTERLTDADIAMASDSRPLEQNNALLQPMRERDSAGSAGRPLSKGLLFTASAAFLLVLGLAGLLVRRRAEKKKHNG